MNNLKIFCITHKPIKNLDKIGLIPVGVGKNNFPSNYIIENSKKNIADKNFCYSETSFHYWIWKNYLPNYNENEWIGTCQYRRYFVKKKNLDKINWLKNNSIWQQRVIINGRVVKNNNSIILASNVIKKALGIKLDTKEKALESQVKKNGK